MTIPEIEKRIAELEVELTLLKHEVLRAKGFDVIPGIGVIGAFANDPTFDEMVRLGREERDRINRESLEEMDREEQAEKRRKVTPGPKKARKSNARS